MKKELDVVEYLRAMRLLRALARHLLPGGKHKLLSLKAGTDLLLRDVEGSHGKQIDVDDEKKGPAGLVDLTSDEEVLTAASQVLELPYQSDPEIATLMHDVLAPPEPESPTKA